MLKKILHPFSHSSDKHVDPAHTTDQHDSSSSSHTKDLHHTQHDTRSTDSHIGDRSSTHTNTSLDAHHNAMNAPVYNGTGNTTLHQPIGAYTGTGAMGGMPATGTLGGMGGMGGMGASTHAAPVPVMQNTVTTTKWVEKAPVTPVIPVATHTTTPVVHEKPIIHEKPVVAPVFHEAAPTPVPTHTTTHHTSPLPIQADHTQVLVQSQMATETETGIGMKSSADFTGVMSKLDATHSSMAALSTARQAEIDEWGQSQIRAILMNTEQQQKQLLTDGEARSLALDDKYKMQLQQWVQQMDVRKAEALKLLENELHAQQQNVLTAAKAQIHNVENEVNARKMEALKQAQMSGASEIDQLSNLVSVAKLRPHTTTTVITTNTETGTVVAAAGPGPALTTGAASAASVASTGAVVGRREGVVTHDAHYAHDDFRTQNTMGTVDAMESTTAVIEKSEHMTSDKTQYPSHRLSGSEPRTSARV